jgi:hypothetical protein
MGGEFESRFPPQKKITKSKKKNANFAPATGKIMVRERGAMGARRV